MSSKALTNPIWSREFDDPIKVDGRTLRTLRDAARFIEGLPSAVVAEPHWQLALEQLIDAAEGRNFVMHAHIAMMRALLHGVPKPVRSKHVKVFRLITSKVGETNG